MRTCMHACVHVCASLRAPAVEDHSDLTVPVWGVLALLRLQEDVAQRGCRGIGRSQDRGLSHTQRHHLHAGGWHPQSGQCFFLGIGV